MSDMSVGWVLVGAVLACSLGIAVAAPNAALTTADDVVPDRPTPAPTETPAPTATPAQDRETATATPTAITNTPVQSKTAAVRNALYEAVNAERSAPLRYSSAVEAAAQLHAEEMAAQGFYSHTWPDGTGVGARLARSSANCEAHGENLARRTPVPRGAEMATIAAQGWLNSPSHRKTMLGDYTKTGIGVAVGEFEDRQNMFVVQVFCS